MNTLCFAFMLVVALLLAAPIVHAEEQDTHFVPASAQGLAKGTSTGWHPLLTVSANFMLGQTDNVPGSVDGVNMNLGYQISGGLGFLDETRRHEWLNTLAWQLTFARTPVVDAWVKSIDNIDLKSSYLYHLPGLPWLGPFVSFRLTTPMLAGYDVRPADTNVARLDLEETITEDETGQLIDGAGEPLTVASERVSIVAAGDKIELTPAFAPLMLREAAGFFLLPVDKEALRIDVRAGFGAWELFVRDSYNLADDNRTPDILELRAMQDSVQLGPEVGATAVGTIRSNVTFNMGMLFMQPVYTNAETDLKGFDLLNMEFTAGLGVKAFEFLSINYSFKAIKQPLVVDAWQMQNNLMISINFALIGEEPKVAACPACPEPPPAPATETPAPAAETPAPAAETPAPPAPAAEPTAPAA